MYVKLFTSIYQGTLRGNSHGLLVFTNLLAHCDCNGEVDVHPRAIAEEVGLSVDDVKSALVELESSDPDSRSPENDGRRIIPMDESRNWGWIVTNYAKYRKIRNEDDRKEQNRESQKRWREKNKPESALVSQGKPQSAQAEAEAEAYLKEANASLSGSTFPTCPHKDLIRLYAKNLPNLPVPRVWDGGRQSLMRQRWVQAGKPSSFSEKGYNSLESGLSWWDSFFGYIANDTKLANGFESNGRTWTPDLPWIIKSSNFAKIIDGKYGK
jgi:hypothetical protein